MQLSLLSVFFLIWICYFGVNLLGIGLHSFGSFTLTIVSN